MIKIGPVCSRLELFRELTDVLVVVDKQPRWCRHGLYMDPGRCEFMILGSMVFCLTRANLWPIPEPQKVCKSMSVMALYKQLANIVIHDIEQPEKKWQRLHEVQPQRLLVREIAEDIGKHGRSTAGRTQRDCER